MRKAATLFGLITFFWGATTFSFIHLFLAPNFLPSDKVHNLSLHVSESSKNDFSLQEESRFIYSVDVLGAAVGADSRSAIVDRFLAKYSSPMFGTGKSFVASSDKFSIDWRLLPAIAFQESSLGKKIPTGSYNPFGWGVYEGKLSGAKFRSWDHAIETVAGGLRMDYLNKGVSSIEEIASRYTSGQNSSAWVFAVNQAMEELSEKSF